MTRAGPRVVVVGSINRDILMHANELPTAGRTVRGDFYISSGGGKGANQAAAAAAVGADVHLIGVVGDDADGHSLVLELDRQGVSTQAIGRSSRPTGLASVVVDRRGENQICIVAGANDDLEESHVVESMRALPPGPATVLVSLEIQPVAVLAAVDEAWRLGWPLILNPAPARLLSAEVLRRTGVLVPNEHEAEELGYEDPADLLGSGVGAVVVTSGAKGSTIHRSGSPPVFVSAFEAHAVDTTGAGDTFCGALASALGRGMDLNDAVRFASAAAALSIATVGARAGLPDQASVTRLLAGARAPNAVSSQPLSRQGTRRAGL